MWRERFRNKNKSLPLTDYIKRLMATLRDHQAAQATAGYELLIHSLTHEHSNKNFDRHLLLFQKWCRDYNDGFYIRDLDFVVIVLGILRERLSSHYKLFRTVL